MQAASSQYNYEIGNEYLKNYATDSLFEDLKAQQITSWIDTKLLQPHIIEAVFSSNPTGTDHQGVPKRPVKFEPKI